MPSVYDRNDFVPPADPRSLRSVGFALLVHALLIAALTWGVKWQRTDQSVGYEAEIWSAVPQQVAPRLVQTAPVTAPVVPPAPTPPVPATPAPPPAPRLPAPAPAPPAEPEVDIALEQEKKRQLIARKQRADAQKLAEKEAAIKVTEAREKKELQARQEQLKQEQAKQEQTKRLAAEEAKKVQAKAESQKIAKQQEAQNTQAQAALQKQRDENLSRMKKDLGAASSGVEGANGSANDTGTALRSAGPSAGYAGKLSAAIKPNVVFSGDINGNPTAVVEVRVMSDGTVISQRLLKSSGDKSWDDAAVNAIIRTRVLPRDVNGRMPDTVMHIDMRPRG